MLKTFRFHKIMRSMNENRVGDSPFVSDTLDGFLQDMAQMYADFGYGEIIAFEKSIQSATDPRLKELKKLYRKSREAMEYDDEDLLAEIVVAVENLVGKKDNLKEGQYSNACCNGCGTDISVGTFERFLIEHGFGNVEFACEIIDADPKEEICEECFNTYIPMLIANYYSEYDEFGTDARTGEDFDYPDY